MYKTTYNPYVCDIAITQNQEKFLVNQVINQLAKFYSGKDNRKMVLNAFTGSGKTTVALKVLIPKFVKKFTNKGKRVIVFMAPRAEVVEQSYTRAKKVLNNKIVSGSVIKCYNSKDINDLKKEINAQEAASLDGDVIVLFLTAQYFGQNFALLTKYGSFDLAIVDEAHIMFGTISKEDTMADKGVINNNFEAHTLDKLRQLTDTAVLFLTATPTNSQQEKTSLGQANNIFLKPMPRDVLTTPFFDIVPYIDSEDTVGLGLEYFKSQCLKIGSVISMITPETWSEAVQFKPVYPAVLIRLARRGSTNGADFEKQIYQISDYCKQHGLRLLLNTSESYNDDFYAKEFDGVKISSLAEGVALAEKADDKPVVIVTIESGYAGLDLQKINNVIIGREPSGTIHNNYSQTGGRAARMKQGFINHADAVAAIKAANLNEEQKRLLSEYYILHSTSVVHVPVDSKLLNGDVKQFIETDTWRENEGRTYVLDNVFGKNHPVLPSGLRLITETSLQDDSYKKFKKTFCECCNVDPMSGLTYCFHTTWTGFENLLKVKISLPEMKLLWPMCLHIHHMDGNHFNNDINNLKTICPNVHSLVTMYNEDYKNRYTELRESLTKIAKKKGSPVEGVLEFKLF
jgi:superfamily II DNA or RNA helicase